MPADRPSARVSPVARFLRYAQLPEDDDISCWTWQGARNPQTGYGTLWCEGRTQYAHRLSYIWFVGPIPRGTEIDHLCRNHACVNPDHLDAVPHVINVWRGVGVGITRKARQPRTHCPAGHAMTGTNIKHARSQGYPYTRCRACDIAAKRNARKRASQRRQQETA